jgi:2-deoxy-D-gluconate 3-dehydrogenase
MDMLLGGKVAIVTGASRGLGEATVRALVAEGVRVLAVGRDAERLQALASELGGAVSLAVADMRRPEEVAALPQAALDAFGGLDIVVNNAGIAPAADFLEQPQAAWEEIFAVNVAAPAVLVREAGRHLVAQRSGKIVNVASTSGMSGKPQLVAYSASKGAVIQFTKALAAEWARHGVQVNAIAPGAFETDAQRAVLESPSLLERRTRKIPARRIAAPAELGPLVCYLASPLADFVTGSVFVIDGGEVAKL